MRTVLLFTCVLLMVASCAPKIDGSSQEALTTSMEEVKAELSEEKKVEFDEAYAAIAADGVNMANIFLGEEGAEKIIKELGEKLDGMTGDDVIEKGNEIIAEQERQAKEDAKKKLAELAELKQKSAQDAEKLKAFEIIEHSFKQVNTGSRYFAQITPNIYLSVRNGLDQAVSRVYFDGKVYTEGRSVPWVEQTFNYSVSGGLEPGEAVEWNLDPGTYSDWADTDIPKDAKFDVTLIRVDDAQGNKLYSSSAFSKDEQAQVDEILAKYPELK